MCDEREKLIEYVYDECDDRERSLVDQHLESCETCREEIAGLRATRQDLLAWAVPDHGSVWKPFVPARQTPWYREVPAWAMAAAAGIMIMLGFSGGLVAQSFAPREAMPAPAAVATTHADDAARRAELIVIERRIADSMRADLAQLDQRVKLVSQQNAGPAALVHAADAGRDMALYTSVNSDMYRMTQRIRSLENQLENLRQLMITQQSGSGSGLNR